MKKIIVKIFIILSLFSFFVLNITKTIYADKEEKKESWPIIVTVTEKIPWANCKCADPKWDKECKNSIYECEVESWFWSVVSMMWSIIKYFTFLAWLWGVLFMVYNGIMYSMWWADQSFKDEAKKRIVQTLIWLIVLFLSWVILNIVAPWVYVV